MKIITRFAPSPTGNLHIGGVRTALFNYLFTRKNEGKYLLRIDDTDKERSKKEYEENILNGFKKVGLLWDNEQILRQSERTAIYKKYIQKLIAEDKAFVSKETDTKEGERSEVIRLRNPNKKVVFSDLIRGEVQFDTTELGDFVIAKSLEEPIYHLASVIDDYEMGITHIIRSEEHLSNTPRQILIQEAIGASRPIYAHIPMILAPDRSKLSKRHGATSLSDYMDRGYLPEAIINYLAFLGWNPGGERELYSLDELIKVFDMAKVQRSAAIFNIEKLNWFNRQYIAKLSDKEFADTIKPFVPEWLAAKSDLLNRLLPLFKEKIVKFGDVKSMCDIGGELAFVKEIIDYKPEMLLWKKNPNREVAARHLAYATEVLNSIELDQFNAENIKHFLWEYAEKNGRGNVLWPLRVALTGQDKSPDPFMSAFILGKEEALARIEKAIGKLK